MSGNTSSLTILFNIDSFAKYDIEVRMNRLIALILGMMILSSCQRSPTEIQIKLTNGDNESDKGFSYSGRSMQPRVSARGSDSNGIIILGKGKMEDYSYKTTVSSRTMFFLLRGVYTADLKLLVDGKICASGTFKSEGPPKQIRLECSIR
jgi:hypothetical protein